MGNTSTDLVERLRFNVTILAATPMGLSTVEWSLISGDFLQAADHIATQQAEIDRLRAALKKIAEGKSLSTNALNAQQFVAARNVARAALTATEPEA